MNILKLIGRDAAIFEKDIEVYENKRMISELLFSDVKINKNMADIIFNIK